MKDYFDVPINKLDTAEKRINELENGWIEIMQTEVQRKRRVVWEEKEMKIIQHNFSSI